ncbi:MAG: PKD domain-containing protein [Flavobacteriales bacterium]
MILRTLIALALGLPTLALAQPNPCDDLDSTFTLSLVGGNTVVFQPNTFNNQWTYFWEFGDGTSDFGPIITHQYPGPTLFQACLTVWAWDPFTQDTCFATSCQLVDLIGQGMPCDSTFSAQITWFDQGSNIIVFQGSTNLNADGYIWQFGDGALGYGMSTQHFYQQPGVYPVCLDAWYWNSGTQDSCWTSTCLQVVVGGGGSVCDSIPLQADFAAAVNGNLVQFTDQSLTSGYGATYLWDLGDGTTSVQPAFLHQYAQSGTYQVCLTIAIGPNGGADSCFATHCELVTIGGTGPCDDLDSTFTFSLVGGSTVVFQPNTFNNQWTYFWEFGDGTSDFGPIITHQYPGPTLFQACLTVWAWDPFTQDTCFATSCQLVDLIGQGDPCDSLQACFVPSVAGPQAFFFNNCSSSPDPFNTQFLWDFGDGTSSTQFAPIHTFPPGVWDVCLTTSWQNCVDSLCLTITATGGAPCDTSFVATFGVTLNGNVATFSASSGGQANGYLWDFGDGTQGGGQLVNHVYPPGGPYNACLQAWYWNGTDTCWTVPACQPVGPFSQNNPCDDLDSTFTFNLVGGSTVVFQPNTFNNQWTYFWEFGDGTSDFGPIITHQYPGPTLFQACLTVWAWDPFTQDTCFATSCQLIDLIGQGSPCDSIPLQADFAAAVNGNLVQFTDQSLTSGYGATYLWDLGDGTTSVQPAFLHQYAQSGTYQVCLTIAIGPNGGADSCFASYCELVTIGGTGPCDDLDSTFTFNLVGGSTVVFQPNTFNNQWTYFWEFGDGTSDFGPIITHQYPGPTLFQACLTVWAWDPFTQDTCFATSCQLIDLVGQGDPCDSLGLVADFTWMSQGTVVMFEDLSQSAVQPLSYFWEFGDGGLSTDPDPAHTYPDTASYQVCLWVGAWTGADSCFAVSCQLVSPGSNGPQAVAGMGSGTTLKVWPNPTNDLLFVELPGTAGPYLVELLDLQGRRIRSRTGVAGLRTQLDLGDLASGFYLVQLRADGLRRTIRVQRQ